MFTKTTIAIAAAIALGSGVAALANEIETNPSTAQSDREWQDFLNQGRGHMGNPTTSYGFAAGQEQSLRKKGH